MKPNIKLVLYIVVVLEGYIILSTELLVIRQLIPFVGNGIEIVSIIISSVLIPLSIGYYVGGNFQHKKYSIRNKLIANISLSSIFILLSGSYVLLAIFFDYMTRIFKVESLIIQTAIFAICFVVYPIYLLGQTIPLISNYFRGYNISNMSGKILCCSTMGSFLGAILPSVILMSLLGVNNIVIINISLLLIVTLLLSKHIISFPIIGMLIMLILTYTLNGDHVMQIFNIVENNRYNTTAIYHHDNGDKTLLVNHNNSAKYTENPENRFAYVKYIEDYFLKYIPRDSADKKSILILGAGGMTIGKDDYINDYTFVDIDSSLKRISEELLFGHELPKNKKFIYAEARSYLSKNNIQYDIIILDAYSGAGNMPFHLLSKEFFQQVKTKLKDKGIFLFNAITKAYFHDTFSKKLDNTLHSVFRPLNRQIMGNSDPWNTKQNNNVIYTYYKHSGNMRDTYTDNLNSSFLDK